MEGYGFRRCVDVIEYDAGTLFFFFYDSWDPEKLTC